jgi:hypothetical protein
MSGIENIIGAARSATHWGEFELTRLIHNIRGRARTAAETRNIRHQIQLD